MPGELVVSLEDIADKMEEASDEWRQFLNIKTGEFLSVQSEHLGLAEDLESDDELDKYSLLTKRKRAKKPCTWRQICTENQARK
jgi:hypothetical protein